MGYKLNRLYSFTIIGTEVLSPPHLAGGGVVLSVAYIINDISLNFLKILFIFRERRREGEKHRSVASHTPPTGDLACNPGMHPDQESNRRHFGLQAGAQPTEPHQPGLTFFRSRKAYCLALALE